ncbi:MAG: hypothetical protein APF76_00340 [Desulfitibacter sp. BRH_c19]|nr:MAG: hypothetical protein APF76_00340 [Desulfitibacter sp. BRH_c19]
MLIKLNYSKPLLILILVASFIMLLTPPHFAQQSGPIMEMEQDYDLLVNEETEVIEKIFNLLIEMENVKEEQKILAHEISFINSKIEHLNSNIEAQRINYENTSNRLKQVFRSYQRLGASSYLEIILQADSLKDFLRRLNTIKDIGRNTYDLLNTLEESKSELELEINTYQEMLLELENAEEQLEDSLRKTSYLKAEMENYLITLEDEREQHLNQLNEMQIAWVEAKPFFLESLKELSMAINRGEIPIDALKTTITLRGIKGTLSQETFNEIILQQPGLSNINFKFLPKVAVLELTDKNLVLEGTLSIINKSSILFTVLGGTFYEFPLDNNSLKDLFQDTQLIMDFQPLLGRNVLQSIEIKDGQIELMIIPNFSSN